MREKLRAETGRSLESTHVRRKFFSLRVRDAHSSCGGPFRKRAVRRVSQTRAKCVQACRRRNIGSGDIALPNLPAAKHSVRRGTDLNVEDKALARRSRTPSHSEWRASPTGRRQLHRHSNNRTGIRTKIDNRIAGGSVESELKRSAAFA